MDTLATLHEPCLGEIGDTVEAETTRNWRKGGRRWAFVVRTSEVRFTEDIRRAYQILMNQNRRLEGCTARLNTGTDDER